MTGQFDMDAAKAQTAKAFASPTPGDLFQEMYSFWMGVVAVTGDYVTWVEKCGHLAMPGDIKVRSALADEWREHFSYSVPDLGYWVLLAKRNQEFDRWLTAPKRAAS